METTAQILGALGALGIFGSILLGALLLFVLPWAAIIDCVRSDRGKDAKTVLVIALVLTWGLGSVFYGLFFTHSRRLRIFTLCAIVIPILLLVPSVISFGSGAKMASDLQHAKEQTELDRFRPTPIDEPLDPFPAVLFAHGEPVPRAATLTRFTLDGPAAQPARDIDKQVRHIAFDADNDRYFALTSHEFGTITPSTGHFTQIEVDPSLGEFGWPKGLAYDDKQKKVIIMTSHVFTRFYRFDPRTSDWERLPAEIRDLPLVGLTYSPEDDCLYALEHGGRQAKLDTVHRFNTRGALLGSITLRSAIPISRHQTEFFQLQHTSGRLLLLLPPFESERERIFAVEPASGEVLVSAVSEQIEAG